MPSGPGTATSPDGDLARDLSRHLAMANAQARAATFLLEEDPVAAARALRGLTQHTSDALQLLRVELTPTDSADVTAGRFGDPFSGFRAGGETLRVTVVGHGQQLSPGAGAAVRHLSAQALATAASRTPGAALSLSLTWSADQLDVLFVSGAATDEAVKSRSGVTDADFAASRELLLDAGGTLRVIAPAAGGFLVAATVPVEVPRSDHRPAVDRVPRVTLDDGDRLLS
jgi:hypothetical protein